MPWTPADCVDGVTPPETGFGDEVQAAEPTQWFRLPTDDERAAFEKQRASCKVSEIR